MSSPTTHPPKGEADASAAVAERQCAALPDRYRTVRRTTEQLCEALEVEDYVIQSMPEASPVKWQLAHTTWFFETFVLTEFMPSYRPFHPKFGLLFNSYYNAAGPRWPRPERGLLSRPTVAEIYRYRAYVDEQVHALFEPARLEDLRRAAPILELGLHHEQQHQELMLTDLKHALSLNPLRPAYRASGQRDGQPPAHAWLSFSEGLAAIGHHGGGFAFDNESPRHRVFLPGFHLSNRLATNRDYLGFMDDDGYQRPELWLSDGWALCQAQQWTAPLYWEKQGADWSIFTLSGQRPLDPAEPLCHVSYFEADAFARWAGARLPTEAEWEVAARGTSLAGHFLDSGHFHPASSPADDDRAPLFGLFGDVWQWTASPYLSYPGYAPPAGALGEYNGKFMCNQFVLRGASCATPRSHARVTYRNFFPPQARWQFAGVRLARDLP